MSFKMEEGMRETIKTIRSMAKAYFPGQMEEGMRETGKTISRMANAYFPGKMEINMRETFLTTSFMVLVQKSLLMEWSEKVSGQMANATFVHSNDF